MRAGARASPPSSTIQIIGIGDVEWEQSRVRRKLARVLWMPVEGERSIPVARRRGHDEDGAIFDTLPRGFYLRATFTARLLERHYVLPR